MKVIFPLLFILLVLSFGIEIHVFYILYCVCGLENDGPLKLVDANICDVKLYNFCDHTCFTDCLSKYGVRALALCSASGECICRYHC
ncbi:hypothetical protein Fmac_025349 [Flemingia macrophylla]|uniref:Defensin-like protein n=1 Tax=Flemingia macrophylla TaxID=520843 RepID=A0ABD1LRY6_9FABA